MPLDRGTKIYALTLLGLILGLVALILYEPPVVRELNEKLAQDSAVSRFPYKFRVLRMEGSTAVMSTPRSSAVPVEQVLGILFPEVAGQPGDSPAFQAAQARLAIAQKRAYKQVIEDPRVNQIRWELDKSWLMEHGVTLPPGG
jgi:hypothetical protein